MKKESSRGGYFKPFLIYGTGDFSDFLSDLVENELNREIGAYILDKEYQIEDTYRGKPVVGIDDILKDYPPSRFSAVIGFLGSNMYEERLQKYNLLKGMGYEMENVIHPSAVISPTAVIGDGNIIYHHVVFATNAVIGNCNIFTTKSNVSHHAVIGDGNYFSPYASTTGYVEVGNQCFLGIHSGINNKVRIADRTFVGGGIFITNDTAENSVFVPVNSNKFLTTNT